MSLVDIDHLGALSMSLVDIDLLGTLSMSLVDVDQLVGAVAEAYILRVL